METLSMLKVGYTLLRSETPATDLVNAFMDWAARRSLLLLAVLMPPYAAYSLAASTSLSAAAAPEDVAGKVVLVTGASSGIGEQLAYSYARRGARLALVARREASLRDVAAAARAAGSPDVLVVAGDVARADDCRRFVRATVEHFGRLDHLVNNAGLANVCWFEEVPDVADFKQVLDVNFWGTVYPTHAAIPHLKESGGKIFVNSSASAVLAMPRMSFYNASKAAVLNFAETLRMELHGEVGVTVATPGWVESEMTKGKHLSKYGKMEVDQDTRDAQVGVFPVERGERCAEAIVDAMVRGRRRVSVPAWYRAMFLWRTMAPEVADACQRLFYRRSGRGQLQMRARRVLKVTGAKAVLQPPSLQSSEIKME
uniref:Ketoreductase domain-containing protein n=1 Tax=Leersia perrieri TaxID=77586 RepID=A0A0D9W4A1_9ORYZ